MEVKTDRQTETSDKNANRHRQTDTRHSNRETLRPRSQPSASVAETLVPEEGGGRRSDMTVASLDGQLLDSCNHMLRWTPHKLTTMSPQLIKQLIVGRRNSSLTRLFKDINYAQLFANNTFLDAHIMYYI